jgi:hydroxymethylpyrimidine kinase/phosphomethylpyrimidine kinase
MALQLAHSRESKVKPEVFQPVVLSIAGVDPSGGAGVLADIKTFAAFGCYGAAAITSLTFQNTLGVFGSANQSGETVRRQIEPVIEDLDIAAIKTGMLPSAEVISEIAALIGEHSLPAPVVDPVVRSTSGFDLIDDAALTALIQQLFPLARIVTPNIAEAERITGLKIDSNDDIASAARRIRELGARNVLIKGGHFQGESARDFLFEGDKMIVFSEPWIDSTATHGTGCTLSSAIAANLALGRELTEAILIAKTFVTEAIRTSPMIGHGHQSLNHLIKVKA